MQAEEIRKNAELLKKTGANWRDPAARLRFEQDAGLAPIITGNSLEVEAQHQSARLRNTTTNSGNGRSSSNWKIQLFCLTGD